MTRYKITDEKLSEAVTNSISMHGVLAYLGIKLAGGSFSHYKKRIVGLGLSMEHFTGQASNRGKISNQRRTSSDILQLRTEGRRAQAHQLVRALLEEGVPHECAKCGQGPSWMGNPLTLDVDHIDENWLDDRIENLRFLCPNCHSQFTRKLLGM